MTRLRIGDFTIGEGCPPFIVAEAGINHNGDIDKAFAMIRLAKKSGADAIKFQTFKAEEFIADPEQTFTFHSQGREVTESMMTMFKRCEFQESQWRPIKECCEQEGILFLSTAQNRSDLDILLKLGIPAVKVGSDDFTNLPLLKSYAATKLPLFLSTGMATLDEVRKSLKAVGTLSGYPTVLFVCTSEYPTPPDHVNLLKFKTLSRAFPGLLLGFSDHTQGSLASSLAVVCGACIFEKHFTLDHDLPGPDHWFSADPQELEDWVHSIRTAHRMMGSESIAPTPQEKLIKLEARRVIVASQEIVAGTVMNDSNLAFKRKTGGKGLPASDYSKLVGQKARRHYKKGEAIVP